MIRTVRTDDAPGLQAFVRGLSPRSRRFRFFSALIELSAAQLQRLIKPDRAGLALVALKEPPQDGAIVAEARYVIDPLACSDAEFAIAVADDFQRQGLGTHRAEGCGACSAKSWLITIRCWNLRGGPDFKSAAMSRIIAP